MKYCDLCFEPILNMATAFQEDLPTFKFLHADCHFKMQAICSRFLRELQEGKNEVQKVAGHYDNYRVSPGFCSVSR